MTEIIITAVPYFPIYISENTFQSQCTWLMLWARCSNPDFDRLDFWENIIFNNLSIFIEILNMLMSCHFWSNIKRTFPDKNDFIFGRRCRATFNGSYLPLFNICSGTFLSKANFEELWHFLASELKPILEKHSNCSFDYFLFISEVTQLHFCLIRYPIRQLGV